MSDQLQEQGAGNRNADASVIGLAQIEDALRRERERNALLSRLISTASHEFRTPLSMVLSASFMLEEYGASFSEDKRQSYLQGIQAAVRQVTCLLDDLVALAKADQRGAAFQPARIDLESLCLNLVDQYVAQAGAEHRLSFVNRGSEREACLDERLVRDMLTALLSNAVKFSPPGSPIEVELACGASDVTLTVRDHGSGIAPDDLKRVFEAFYRGRNAGGIPGLGMGLAIVKRAVDLHEGAITLDSQPGIGTVIAITLPRWSQRPEI